MKGRSQPPPPPVVLVVDDEPLICGQLIRALGRLGWQAEAAHNAREALALVATRRYAAAVLDLGLPDRSGVSLLGCLRQRAAATPVVVYSAYVEASEVRALLAAGAHQVVRKQEGLRCLVDCLVELVPAAARQQDPVVAYIDAHLAAIRGRADIAAALHMAPDTLSRHVRRATGLALHEYLTRRRVTESERLLTTTQMTCKQIASAVGFRSHDASERAFKRLTGQTPGEYRRAHSPPDEPGA